MIVEDEEIIRDGLANFIDWESIGFDIVAKTEDGRDALEYLENNVVDVVLTDIKMTFVSGLELAKYFYENQLETKVVIISGYKEFEYARQAIKYNVDNYLLKPFDVDTVIPVFEGIKEELDLERERKIKAEKEKKEYHDLIPLLRDQFFLDLLVGAIKDKDEIKRKLKLLKFDLIPEKTMCIIVNFYISKINKELQSIEGSSPYPMGTTVPITTHGKVFYFTVMADFNDQGNASTTQAKIRSSLEGLWNYVRESGELQELVIPVLGTGRGRLKMSRKRMVTFIAESFMKASEQNKFTEKLVIVIRPEDAKKFGVNLYDIKDNLNHVLLS